MTRDTEDVVRLIASLRYWEGDGHPHGLLHRKAASALQSLSDRIDGLEGVAVELVMAGNAWPQHTITADEAAFEARQVYAALHQEGIRP